MDGEKPTGPKAQYIASLVDIEDQDVTYSNETIEATTVAEAISKARQWAQEEYQKTGNALLILKGSDGPGALYSEVFSRAR